MYLNPLTTKSTGTPRSVDPVQFAQDQTSRSDRFLFSWGDFLFVIIQTAPRQFIGDRKKANLRNYLFVTILYIP